MGVGVFGGTVGVGRGGIGVEVAVGAKDSGRVQPARRMPEIARERKIDQGLTCECGNLMNIDMPLFESYKYKSYHKTIGGRKMFPLPPPCNPQIQKRYLGRVYA
jgi:hypothetical protein